MLSTIRMAPHTILKVGDAFLTVLFLNFCLIVLVAVVASVAGIRARVAGLAGIISLAMVDGEGMVKVCVTPVRGAVTGGAIRAELPVVLIVACVAGVAVRRYA